MKGFHGFESWDETYVHTKHNDKDRTVLEYREEQGRKEPWTWVRTQGKGRVFYTAWGHDERTWGHPGFQNLVERGIRWAVGADPGVVPPYSDRPEMTTLPKDVKPFEYIDVGAKIPQLQAGHRQDAQPDAEAPVPGRVHEAHGPSRGLRAETVRLGRTAGRQAHLHELGRAGPAVGRRDLRLPQRAAAGRQGPRPHPDLRGHRWRRPGRQGHRLRRQAQHPHQPHLRPGRRHRPPGAAHAVPQDTEATTADERKVLFTGWGTGDTHAGPSNLRYGLDNWIYGIVGYSGFSGTVAGEKHQFGQGFYRFRPDGSKLEFLRSTNNNSWGVGFSEEGLLFGSTANGNPSVYMPIPNRYYEAVRGWSSTVLRHHRRQRPDLPDHRQGAPGRLPRRLHGGGRPCPVHRPRLSPRILEPHGLRRRADRPSRRAPSRSSPPAPASARATPGTCSPATTSGARRSWPRSDPTATSG